MRLIDADALINNIPSEEIIAKMFVAHAPTIEPKRGEWKVTNTYKDHNGRIVDRIEHTDCGYIWHREMGKPLHNFCPNCGARMKGADDAEDSMR